MAQQMDNIDQLTQVKDSMRVTNLPLGKLTCGPNVETSRKGLIIGKYDKGLD